MGSPQPISREACSRPGVCSGACRPLGAVCPSSSGPGHPNRSHLHMCNAFLTGRLGCSWGPPAFSSEASGRERGQDGPSQGPEVARPEQTSLPALPRHPGPFLGPREETGCHLPLSEPWGAADLRLTTIPLARVLPPSAAPSWGDPLPHQPPGCVSPHVGSLLSVASLTTVGDAAPPLCPAVFIT